MYRKIIVALVAAGLLMLTGCKKDNMELYPVTIESYERLTYETTQVRSGDFSPEVALTLLPADKEVDIYSPPSDGVEVDTVFVKQGDYVSAGDKLISYRVGDTEDKMEQLQDELATQQYLLEHYENMAAMENDPDYQADIEQLKKDMEVTKLYISEEHAKNEAFTLKAERDGVIEQISDLVNNEKVNMNDRLIFVMYNSGEYYAITSDPYPFEVGMVVQAKYRENEYDMELISIEGDKSKTLLFRAKNPREIMRANYMDVVIEKQSLKGVLYVEQNAVLTVNDKSYVFTLNEDGFKEAVEVEVGNVVGDYIIIESGVKAGDKVVMN